MIAAKVFDSEQSPVQIRTLNNQLGNAVLYSQRIPVSASLPLWLRYYFAIVSLKAPICGYIADRKWRRGE